MIHEPDKVAALILAAGRGTRLSNRTNGKPKCLVELGGKTIIQRQLETFRRAGINNIIVVGGFRAELLENLDVRRFRNDEYENSNMVWSMLAARELFSGDRDIIITYGDILFEDRLLNALRAEEYGDLVVSADRNWLDLWSARMNNPLDDAETFAVNGQDELVDIGKKPEAFSQINGQYIGLIKVPRHAQKALLAFCVELERRLTRSIFMNLYMTDLLQELISAGWKVKTSWTNNGWIEFDTEDDLDLYESLLERGQLGQFCRLN